MNEAIRMKGLDIKFRDDQNKQSPAAPQKGLGIPRRHVKRMKGRQISIG